MTTGHTTSDMAGRIAQLRAEIGDLRSATYSQGTLWPGGFDVAGSGAVAS